MLRRCIESLTANTRYPDYEIAVIDNQSDDPALARYLQELGGRAPLRTFRYDRPFNHSDMHNQVVPRLDAPLIVLANNDLYDFAAGWLEQLVATAELDESIAGAGGKLFFPDGTVQHAGIVIAAPGMSVGHVGHRMPGDSPGYLGRARALQEMSAVTAALMIVKKSAFLEVGGFDARRYPTSYNDIDLWIRLGEAGYRCLFNPKVQAFHEESKSRGRSAHEAEYVRRLDEDLAARAFRDSFWNPALFDRPFRMARREHTAQWTFEKLRALEQECREL
jgi:GT2 family glycosyltransferase